MKIRLLSFIGFFLAVAVSIFFSQKIDYRPFSFASDGAFSGQAALVGSAKASDSASESGKLLICSHGTNSHKEVFLPIASIMAVQGVKSLLIDSAILSTNEGITKRVKEIQDVQNAINADIDKPATIIALGHSDGGPPSLALKATQKDETGSVIILGSHLSEAVPQGIPTRGFVGGFDQIFPAEEMIIDFQNLTGKENPVRVSWLSDHFTEQYDPILLSAISENIAGPDSPAPYLVGLGLLLLAAGIMFAFFAGTLCGNPEGERTCYAWGIALFIILSLAGGSKELFQQFPVSATLILFFLLGFNGGFVPEWKHVRPLLIFFALMELNIVLGTAFFWENLGAAFLWLPVFLLWYPVAWVCKIGLFGFSLMHRVFPGWMVAWHLPWLLLAMLPFIFSRGIIPCFQGLLFSSPAAATLPDGKEAGRTTADQKQTRLAVMLVVVMFGLWAIRFSQGMIKVEILQAIAGNFLRTLLLPCFFLIYMVFRRTRKADNK